MSIKQPIYHEFDLNATSGSSRVISLTHTDDAHVDVIELCVKQQGAPVDITGATVVARMVLHSTADILLNDSVSCTINSAGNILIPFDNAAIQSRKGIVKIEVNITRTPDILTLQLPLWVKINGSILDSATVDPHSEGTIPELLKEVREELERVEGFATLNDVFEILDSTLKGATNVEPSLFMSKNKKNEYVLVYVDSDGITHEIFNFSEHFAEGKGADGKSAYEIAVEHGFIGTEEEWLASLVGATGAKGDKGDKGDTGAQGAKGDKGDKGAAGADGIGIADVHIDGGGDLIIEYTTGHMENVGHVVGADGQDYVLTAQDKSDIADIVLSELPIYNGGVQ